MASGSWAPASSCNNQVEGKGGKREKSNREYSSKVLASKDLHYIYIGINEMGSIYELNCRMPEEKGKSEAYRRLASSSSFKHLAASEEIRVA